MKILALDPATKTGWAHSNGKSGVWDFTIKKDESPGIRLLKFRNKLKDVNKFYGIDLVAYETPRGFGHWNALSLHSKFAGIIEEFCAEFDILCKGYVATAIKMHATLNGRASKEEMVSRAEFKFGKVIDDNHADALWILDLAVKDFKQ